MDKQIRMEILKMTVAVRQRLEEDILAQFEGTYGMNRDGQFEPVTSMPTMKKNPVLAQERQDLETAVDHEMTRGAKTGKAEALARFAREVAFTYLNRLAALRMMEARSLIVESIGRGLDSSGFKTFQLAFASNTPSPEAGYRRYLELLFDETAVELSALFNRSLPASILFPSAPALKDVLAELNREDLNEIWLEDETIGWIYQYFTPKEQRDKARKESPTPRNSYELSFRNQFYTPSYVVRFLTQNTLGRLWLESYPNSDLTSYCEYLVQPHDSSPRRHKKDPREIRVLDPACGSGHFLLYAFDLLHKMYAEAGFAPEEIPTLILANNLFGIDIDLRATQITSLALYLKAKKTHPNARVSRTNIVCAEPMPGDPALFEAFVTTLGSPALERLARVVWQELELAPEAGSLLRPEARLRDAVLLEKEKASQGSLWEPSLHSATPDKFWECAEDRLVSLLGAYTNQVNQANRTEGRLFQSTGTEGFRFIDVLRQRYDVVLMNPPFGKPSKGAKSYIDRTWPRSRNDLFASFVDRGLELLNPDGLLGAITSRTGFFLSSFEPWRREVIMQENSLELVVDLGEQVLDTAMVETACYTIRKSPSPTRKATFIRLLVEEDKPGALLASCQAPSQKVYVSDPRRFDQLPGAPFVYWVPAEITGKLAGYPTFDPAAGEVRQGLSTADDFRFVRAFWEVPSGSITGGPFEYDLKLSDTVVRQRYLTDLERGRRWVYHIKAGDSQPWFTPQTVVVDWEHDGQRLKAFTDSKGKQLSVIRNEEFYFLGGFSWTLRASRFIPYVVPQGCIPSASRYQAFPHRGKEATAIVVAASMVASAFLRFYAEKFVWPKFLVDTVKKLPWPSLNSDLVDHLERAVPRLVNARRRIYQHHEPFLEFTVPSLLQRSHESADDWDLVSLLDPSVEAEIARGYGLLPKDADELSRDLREVASYRLRSIKGQNEDDQEPEDEGEESESLTMSPSEEAESLLSYCVGVVLGRWDVRMALDRSLIPNMPGPFDPPPVCPLGTLVGPDGLPARAGVIAGPDWLRERADANRLPDPNATANLYAPENAYPVDVLWSGVAPDDEEHGHDLTRKVGQVLALLDEPSQQDLEATVVKLLEARDLRTWISTSFFQQHLKRYTKSRRKAPVYWQLRSSKKSYGLWLYYPRLTRDTLYIALRDYVEPKLAHERENLQDLRERMAHARLTGSKDERSFSKQCEVQEDLINEIAAFRDEIKAVAEAGYDPDLNDGVLINIAPLHKLVPWKEAEKCYKDLKAGKYPWSSMHQRYKFR